MGYSSQMRPPQPRFVADPALIALVIITAVSALATQPFWSLRFSEAPSGPTVHVTANETVTVDGAPVAGDLVNHIEHVLEDRDGPVVYFDADDETTYGYASHVMQQIRRAGGQPLPR